MQRIARLLSATLGGAVLLACAGSDDLAAGPDDARSPDPILAPVGAEIFRVRCAACHGISATGDGPAAEALRIPPADLTRIAARRGGAFPAAEISRTIDGRFDLAAHGSREMPIWGERLGEGIPDAGIADEVVRGRIGALVEYLKSIQQTE